MEPIGVAASALTISQGLKDSLEFILKLRHAPDDNDVLETHLETLESILFQLALDHQHLILQLPPSSALMMQTIIRQAYELLRNWKNDRKMVQRSGLRYRLKLVLRDLPVVEKLVAQVERLQQEIQLLSMLSVS